MIVIYDENRNQIKKVQIKNSDFIIDNGEHSFNVEAAFSGGEKPEIQVSLKTLSEKTELMSH